MVFMIFIFDEQFEGVIWGYLGVGRRDLVLVVSGMIWIHGGKSG